MTARQTLLRGIQFLFIVASVGCVFASAQTTYYVATNGSDSNNGTSLTTPFLTIAHAIGVVNPGDTILVRGGTYTGGKVVTRNGTMSAWITLENYNNETVIWNATSTDTDVIYFYGDGNFDPMYWIVNGLHLVGGTQYTVKIDCPWVKILNSDISQSTDDLIKMVSTAKHILIYGNYLHNQAGAQGSNAQGVDAVGTDWLTVAHNYFYDMVESAAIVKGNVRHVTFEYNRVDNTQNRGFCLGQSTGTQYLNDGTYESYDGIIRNNIFINTGGPCMVSSSAYDSRIYNNTCYEAGTNFVGAVAVLNESQLTPPQANTNVYISNNIVYGSNTTSQPAIHIGTGAMTDNSTLYLDNNIYYNTGGAAATTFSWDDLSLTDVSLATWQSKTGKDLNSRVADPGFANLGNIFATLSIAATSPAVDSAICDTTHFCADNDYVATPRPVDGKNSGTPVTDIGAYEFMP